MILFNDIKSIVIPMRMYHKMNSLVVTRNIDFIKKNFIVSKCSPTCMIILTKNLMIPKFSSLTSLVHELLAIFLK
jgi:hypothetical protein